MSLSLAGVPDLGSVPTASEIVLKHLRTAIVTGVLDEGAPIRQDEVAALFNVSKIPVREALKQLEAEGFVSFQRNRGAVVARLSEPEIAQIFEVRAMLEANAIRLSVPLMTGADIALAAAHATDFDRETDVSRWADLNWAFHSSLYLAAGRPYLLQMIRTVNDRVERYLRVQLTLSGGHETASREHALILAACRDGDADGAALLVQDHIMGACRSLHRHLPRKDG
ncbi:GntR family transcriptional regulator [Gemmobacter denitrificans]|uniref:GntR family transcriptional regulator n=1 Tax=Gemmobacter denitrificans TaxID=3123040 RepID=A0ABU8BV37_9RHOB